MKVNKLKTKAENMERSPPQIMALKMTWKKIRIFILTNTLSLPSINLNNPEHSEILSPNDK